MGLIDIVVDHLQNGTIPTNDKMQELCGQFAIVFTAYRLWATEHKTPVTLQIINHVENTGRVIPNIHMMWTAVALRDVIKNKDMLTEGFDGIEVIKISEVFDIYIALTNILEHTCQSCKQIFHSDVNRRRCEASHSGKKPCSSFLRLQDLKDYWDSLNLEERRGILKTSAEFVHGVPPDAVFPKAIQRVLDAAKGKDVDFSGKELMVSLDQASESTYDLRLARAMKKPMLYSRTDYIAAMANEIITDLATAQADAAAREILRIEEETKKRDLELKEKKRIETLEKKMFPKRRPVARKTFNWADDY